MVMTQWFGLAGHRPGEWELAPGDVALIRGPDPYRVADRRESEPIAVIHPGQVCTTPDGVDLHQSMAHGVRTWGNDPDGADTMVVASYESTSEIGRLVTDALPAVAYLPAGRIDPGSGRGRHRRARARCVGADQPAGPARRRHTDQRGAVVAGRAPDRHSRLDHRHARPGGRGRA